jgi:hypothetical protein
MYRNVATRLLSDLKWNGKAELKDCMHTCKLLAAQQQPKAWPYLCFQYYHLSYEYNHALALIF